MSTSPATAVAAVRSGRTGALLRSPATLRRLALGSVITNVLIVVTGGVVRLTDSGLGCPTWPSCAQGSLTPTQALSGHSAIEFGNRMLTFVVGFFVVATWIVAMLRREQRTLATLAALSIPAQALLGGLTVLTDLNPWLVAAHFMLSMAILFVTGWLWWRVRADATYVELATPALWLVRSTTVAALAVLVAGTVVTGAGPHAGDPGDDGSIRRIGVQASSMSQLHADLVWILIGLSVGVLVLAYTLRTGERFVHAAWVLLGVELLQGVIGYTQYFLHVPAALVTLHMLGACLVWLAALNLLASASPNAAGLSKPRSSKARLLTL